MKGPGNVTGEQIVMMVEGCIGEPIKDIKYKDSSIIDAWEESMPEQKNLIKVISRAGKTI